MIRLLIALIRLSIWRNPQFRVIGFSEDFGTYYLLVKRDMVYIDGEPMDSVQNVTFERDHKLAKTPQEAWAHKPK